MTILAVVNLFCLTLLAIIHLVMAWLLYRYLTQDVQPASSEPTTPSAVVILCLRGADPFLSDTLRALLAQDYPHYRIHVVIDSEADPSWQIVSNIAANAKPGLLTFEPLRQRLQTCGLKCSAIVQAFESITTDEIAVFCDADVVPYPEWLSQLVEPLSDPAVGVSTGSQWFEPRHGQLGSLIRKVWHAGAIIPTVLYRNPWAGSCAMRVTDIRRAGLIDRWRTTIVDDGPIGGVMRELGLRVHVVPTLVIVNREECGFRFCASYVRRMLTWSRVYERTFVFTPIHMLGMLSSIIVAVALLIHGLFAGHSLLTAMAATGLVLFSTSLVASYLLVETAVTAALATRHEKLDTRWSRLPILAAIFGLAVLVYSFALIPAIFSRRVSWRQVTYEIRGPWNIKRLDDPPLLKQPEVAGEVESL